MKTLHIDFETRSRVDLRKANVYVYAADRTTDIWCAAYAFGDEPVRLWKRGEPCPAAIAEHIAVGGELAAWNAQFERVMWKHVLTRRYGWPEPALRQWRCVMAEAYAMALPGALDACAAALRMPQNKDAEGYRVMLQLCQPRAWIGEEPQWWDDAAKLNRLYAYCKQDVEVERAIEKKLLRLRPSEREVYMLDQLMNDRGVRIDAEFCDKAKHLSLAATKRADASMRRVTGDAVKTCSAASALTAWLRGQGIELDSLAKGEMDELLALDLTPAARAALELRRDTAKTSVAKIDAMLNRMSADDRMRGNTQYHGAGTGRFAGRGAQLQNLPRPVSKDIDAVVSAIMTGDIDTVRMLVGNPLQAVSDGIRSAIIAGPGREFMDADFSNIEGRVIAWLAGDSQKIARFEAFDKGAGPDIYLATAASVYNTTVENAKPYRQIGKVCIAEGELVLTQHGLVPIENVTLAHQVWDGLEWVPHTGVVCNGYREVVTHDGLTATADHIVFAEDGRTLPLGACARQQIKLAQTGIGRTPIWFGDGAVGGNTLGGGQGQAGVSATLSPCVVSMHEMRAGEMDFTCESGKRKNPRVPELQSDATPAVRSAVQTNVASEAAMHQPGNQGLRQLWGAGDSISVPLGARGDAMGAGELEYAGSAYEGRYGGSYRRGRPLRAGKFTHHHFSAAAEQPTRQREGFCGGTGGGVGGGCVTYVSEAVSRSRVRGQHHSAFAASTDDVRADTRSFFQPPVMQTKRRVWDILNAGPRHRFTVSGRLVHNCELALGYQGGPRAFAKMAVGYGLKVAEALPSVWDATLPSVRDGAVEAWEDRGKQTGMERDAWLAAELIKVNWRNAHPAIVAFWSALEQAAIRAMLRPGEVCSAGPISYRHTGAFLWCRLPGGRVICYPFARLEEKKTPWGDARPAVVYETTDQYTRKWGRKHLYSGLAAENVTQAVARDVMVEAQARVEAAGIPVVLTVHDEILAEPKVGAVDFDTFIKVMSEVPKWATGLPVAVSGWKGLRYRK